MNGETVGESDYVLAPDEVSTSKVRRFASVLATYVCSCLRSEGILSLDFLGARLRQSKLSSEASRAIFLTGL